MSENSTVQLTRDVSAVKIPSGELIHMPAGTSVVITQALGDSYTLVFPSQPGLYRLGGEDADALGREIGKAGSSEGKSVEDLVWDQLKNCYDPEIPLNIADLGLIYSVDLKDADGGKSVNVKMTLTAPGCGMGPAIADDAKRKILTIPGITEANVDLVWEPAWSADRISIEGKKKLGML